MDYESLFRRTSPIIRNKTKFSIYLQNSLYLIFRNLLAFFFYAQLYCCSSVTNVFVSGLLSKAPLLICRWRAVLGYKIMFFFFKHKHVLRKITWLDTGICESFSLSTLIQIWVKIISSVAYALLLKFSPWQSYLTYIRETFYLT